MKFNKTPIVVVLTYSLGSLISTVSAEPSKLLKSLSEEFYSLSESELITHNDITTSLDEVTKSLNKPVIFLNGNGVSKRPIVDNLNTDYKHREEENIVFSSFEKVASGTLDVVEKNENFKAPEPSTSAMIGLAGFAIILRRRL